jgi:UDP-N-acetyl-D-glucosamine dehydrogenase
MSGEPAAELRQRLLAGTARVGVVGMGYVGLPAALAFAARGFPVLGFDIDPAKVEALAEGRCYIGHLDGRAVAAAVAAGRLAATCDFSRLGEPDAIVVCVPTPLTPQREPDLSHVRATTASLRLALRPGQLVVLESTTYPGTTEELLLPELTASGLACGRDFFLAFSPEREDPGNRRYAAAEIPKVVGGVDPVSAELAQLLYERGFGSTTVRVSGARTAEATKLTENVFRAVNIALVNELKMVYDRMGIDVWEVLDAAQTKPFGFMRFNPGPGWGGHCIPLDPFYLAWKAREYGIATKFVELAGEINVEMPGYVVGKLQAALNERGRAVKGSRILVLGIAYKRDVADPRESPAFEVLDRLLALGAEVSYHDPHLPLAPAMRSWPHLPPLASVALTEEALAASDAVVLLTDHSAVDYRLVARAARLIVDTRGVVPRDTPNLVRA